MIRFATAALTAALALPAIAQGNAPAPSSAAPTQPYAQPPAPPQSYPPAPQPGYSQPSPPTPPQQPPRYPEAQPVSPSTSGTGSQQVVVNPPQPVAPPAAAPPPPPVTANPPSLPPSSTSVVNQSSGAPIVVQREAGRSPLEIVAVDAAYGAVAGALVGVGIALLDQGNWGRNLTLGTGAGILVGAVVGGIEAYGQSHRTAMDGLGSPDRDRLAANGPRAAFSFQVRF